MDKNIWRPILDGPQRDTARAAALAVAHALPQFSSSREHSEQAPEPYRFLSALDLGGGLAGAAMLAHRLELAGLATVDALAQREDFLARAKELAEFPVEETPPTGGLYSGIAGVLWTRAQLDSSLSSLEEDPHDKFDDLLLAVLGESPWKQEYDLISGFAGVGFYFLERLPAGRSVEGVEAALDCLEETSQEKDPGITWFTPPERLPEHQRKIAPQGYFNLGLAHGVPGAIVFLARACAAGIGEDRARPLLEGAMRWILAQRLPENPRCAFDSWLAPGVESHPSRTAWCYGDLGLAAALFYAARCVQEKEWEREALAFARKVAVRPFELCGIADAGVCHGAAGNGHIFNRLYQATREQVFLDAARFWFEKTLALRRPGEGVAGFLTWSGGVKGEPEWKSDSGFLSGAAGVGLALLAASESGEPEWDRPLLVAAPPVA